MEILDAKHIDFRNDFKKGQNIIQIPYIEDFRGFRTRYMRKPKAKYVVITKQHETEKCFYKYGLKGIKRIYHIGILTDKNRYYKSELVSRNLLMTPRSIKQLLKVVLYRYDYTKDTKILIYDSIDTENEPFGLIFRIMASTLGINVKRSNKSKILKALNSRYHYVVAVNDKSKICEYHNNFILERLHENDRFDFITDTEWWNNLALRKDTCRNACIECAIGILYLNIKETAIEYRDRYLKRLKEKPEDIKHKSKPNKKKIRKKLIRKRKMFIKKHKEDIKQRQECEQEEYNILNDINQITSKEE